MSNGPHTTELPGSWPAPRIAEPIPLTQPAHLPNGFGANVQAAQEKGKRWGMIEHFAGLALQGLLAGVGYNVVPSQVAQHAVNIGEALVSELERRRNL